MSLDTKVRPTFTIGDLQIIAIALEREIKARINSGDTNNNFIVHLLELKKYAESFNSVNQSSAASLLAQMVGTTVETVNESIKQTQIESYAISQVSPLDAPNLTDEQKFDLLSLKKESQRSQAENEWFLNVGTIIKIQRMSKSPINSGDL